MRQEYEVRRQAMGREVAELREQREAARQQLVRWSQECDQVNCQLEAMRERRRELHTRLAVTDKKLKEIRSATARLQGRRAAISQEALEIQEEFTAREAELRQLQQHKTELSDKIIAAEAVLQEILRTVASCAGKKAQIEDAVVALESQKEKLTQEIAQRLTSTVQEETVRTDDLNDITLVLMQHIADRESIKSMAEERAPALAELRENIAALAQQCQVLEEARALENRKIFLTTTTAQLTRDNDTQEHKIAEHQQRRSALEQELETLTRGNTAKAETIAGLEDKVGRYDDLRAQIKDTELRLAELSRLNEGGVLNIKELFDNSIRWEGECRRLAEMLTVMHQSAKL